MWFFRAGRQSTTTATPSISITVQVIPAWHWQQAASELVSCGLTQIPVRKIKATLSGTVTESQDQRYEYDRSALASSPSAIPYEQPVPTLQLD
jgi:hypothetical protein